ncbi:methylenetetrahydrofolate reductase [Salinigranum salinum]|uniref:methylenetetrahydrofolate reductase n=1 Tax=Salinigranum salinum TaxID=1364937 RepID=UPI001260B5C3|nr:methylenetetrahydrofolate reductase [Salinigranum salinum]
MSLDFRSTATTDGASQLLTSPRYELMPFDSFGEQLRELPDGAEVAITTSPQLGLDATVDWAERASAQGYQVVPHVAARYVEDEARLEEVARRLRDAGVTDIFVPGGDREEPAGPYESAHDLLVALDELDYSFAEVGITGYPEGHDFIDDRTLAEAMARKAPYATYIVTQLCYDPQAVVDWIDEIRTRRIDLPVEVGVPGVMKYQRLLQISRKVGVGDSVKFLKKTTGVLGFVRQLVSSRGKYAPDELLDGLAPYASDPTYDLRGVHLYTFNQVSDLESWRRSRLTE